MSSIQDTRSQIVKSLLNSTWSDCGRTTQLWADRIISGDISIQTLLALTKDSQSAIPRKDYTKVRKEVKTQIKTSRGKLVRQAEHYRSSGCEGRNRA
jgi:hypothetical protein